ncbi:MAG: PEP-CTERM sorting domain-containing protein [Akkermansiaceae bacterium]|nr:PEP-CTERM sorting domain-containing protein [Akkermansiaceae bacterium]MCP5543114.1 PEP-CTERM sorting domain-containing protein [Akkermansiaceae bacterium]
MNRSFRTIAYLALIGAVAAATSEAQQLPNPVEVSLKGAFVNGVAESSNSILISDNDLTNGYVAGFDLHDAPVTLATAGPEGSAAFQWGEAATSSAYPHASALWFEPAAIGPMNPEQYFEVGFLYYRNGTISGNPKSNVSTGASSVDLQLEMTFTAPAGVDPMNLTFQSSLINTVNNSDPYASADIVTLDDAFAPIEFTDAYGNLYFFELSFQVDEDTMDGTLSTQDQFRVFEGGQGGAVLLGRFTTNPFGLTGVPEPSTFLLTFGGALLALRRRR